MGPRFPPSHTHAAKGKGTPKIRASPRNFATGTSIASAIRLRSSRVISVSACIITRRFTHMGDTPIFAASFLALIPRRANSALTSAATIRDGEVSIGVAVMGQL
jgi:hypothetical protein